MSAEADRVRRDIEQMARFMRENRRSTGRLGVSAKAMQEIRRNPLACGCTYASGDYYHDGFLVYPNAPE